AREARQRLERERKIGVDIERAVLIFAIEAIVRFRINGAIDNAALHQKFAPGVIAVASEQSVIEIENCQSQNCITPKLIRKKCIKKETQDTRRRRIVHFSAFVEQYRRI